MLTAVWADLLTEFSDRLHRLNRTPTTRQVYLATVRRLLRRYPTVALPMITAEHIERALWERNISPRSFCTEVLTLRPFFNWLRDQKRLIKANPCDGVELPKWAPKLRPAPSWEDFLAMRRACRTLGETLLLETFYFTGLRMAELRAVRLRDVDLTLRRIQIVGKGGREELVFFPQRVADLMRLWCWKKVLLHPEAHLLTNTGLGRHRPHGEVWINARLRGLGRRAGVPYRVTAHVLRHGFARLLKTRGVDLEVARRLMRHTDIRTTAMVYGQLGADDVQRAYERALESRT